MYPITSVGSEKSVSVGTLLLLPIEDTTTAPPPIASPVAATTAVRTLRTVDNIFNLSIIPVNLSIEFLF